MERKTGLPGAAINNTGDGARLLKSTSYRSFRGASESEQTRNPKRSTVRGSGLRVRPKRRAVVSSIRMTTISQEKLQAFFRSFNSSAAISKKGVGLPPPPSTLAGSSQRHNGGSAFFWHHHWDGKEMSNALMLALTSSEATFSSWPS